MVLGLPLAHLVFGFGQGAKDASYVGGALIALAIGLVPFTVQYVCLRSFYALEDTRTTFFLQCLIAGMSSSAWPLLCCSMIQSWWRLGWLSPIRRLT